MSLFNKVAGYAKDYVQGLEAEIAKTIATPTQQAQENPQADWRVRLSLAPNSTYLYNTPGWGPLAKGILGPLHETNGVIFPYTPNIQLTYTAAYTEEHPIHSNYKIYQYKNSSVEQFTLTCDFTAQDTYEANYVLAVIHFFRSVTKMFYGKDQNPIAGTPPPLCFLHGLGAYHFDEHPVVITSFSYTLPQDVDYIRAGISASPAGTPTPGEQSKETVSPLTQLGTLIRLAGRILPGGNPVPPVFSPPVSGSGEGTYVPTKITMNITMLPVISRNEISNNFSLKDYANGSLLRGSQRQGGGIW